MSDNQTYTVLTTLNHSGKIYERGSFIDLDAETAGALVGGPTPTIRKGKFQLADSEIVEKETPKTDPAPSTVSDAAGKGDKDVNEVTPEGDLVQDQGGVLNIVPGEADQL